MAKLNNLAKMVRTAQANSVATSFIDDLTYSICKDNQSTGYHSKSLKPSSIGGCERSMYYELIGANQDVQSESMELVGICESGTDRHETIQNYIMNMKNNNIECEWLDVGEYLKNAEIKDPQVIKKTGNETKLFSEKYNMRFMCDGLIKYRGEIYIIEIKTESTHKYQRHDEPYPSHILQATCYAMNLKVDKVIFIYENRDNCSKKGYLVDVSDKMIQRVENIVNRVTQAVRDNKIPPRELDKCLYCKYKGQCRKDGN